jgi:hypothetical protein
LKIEHLLPKTEKAPGPINPAFRYADNLTGRDILNDTGRFFPLSEAKRNSLVEAAKSPTATISQNLAKKHAFMAMSRVSNEPSPVACIASGAFSGTDRKNKLEAMRQHDRLPVTAKRGQAIIEYRQWCDEFRIRTRVLGTANPPKPVEGQRESKNLTTRAALKISESCAYMASGGGGYQTFLTATFDDEARGRIDRCEITIQGEITRAMDGLQKMYRRGWKNKLTGVLHAGHNQQIKAGNIPKKGQYINRKKVSGEVSLLFAGDRQVSGNFTPLVFSGGDSLPYCWVVEIPENDQGEPNPHVHILLGWKVEYSEFKGWASRIESLWGQGFAHLEKIKDSEAAGAYMAKAAGYLCKAQGKDDQGRVIGNRYAISSSARAPGWELVAIQQLGIMGQLIRDVYDTMTQRYAGLYAQRRELNAAREKVRIKAKAIQNHHPQKQYPFAGKTALEKIGHRLMAVRNTVNSLPARAGKYQLIIKGGDNMRTFMEWAEKKGLSRAVVTASPYIGEFKARRRLKNRLKTAWQSLGELAAHTEQTIDRAATALCEWETYNREYNYYAC